VSARLYLEDLRVGQRFSSAPRAITVAEIKDFAARFDPQPFHLDETEAKASFFEGLAASGWHTAALTMRMLVEEGPQMVGGAIGAGGALSWPQPTRPGDALRIEVTIEEIKPSRSRPDRGMVKMRIETLNQRDEAVQVFVVDMLAFRRPGPSG